MGWDQSSDTVVIEDLTFVFFINCRFDSKLAAPRHEFAKDQCSQHKFADILWWWMCFGACGASILHIVKQIDCFEGALPFLSLTDSLPPRLSRLPHLPHLRWVTDLTYLVIIPKKLNSERSDILWRFACGDDFTQFSTASNVQCQNSIFNFHIIPVFATMIYCCQMPFSFQFFHFPTTSCPVRLFAQVLLLLIAVRRGGRRS